MTKGGLIAAINRASWRELGTRVRQEVAKRLDAACYRFGVPCDGGIRFPGNQEHGRFFFKGEDLPAVVTLLQQRLHRHVEENVRRAECICRHEFNLLGYERLAFGPEIDWHLDIVNGKRPPLKPWFEIRYLDFEEVGDSKIIWELNRHQYFMSLARAYLFTGDQRFAEELFLQWYDWWQKNPYPMGINWASSLEVAFRSLSWLWADRLLEGCPIAPKHFRRDLLRALGISGRHIERYLSTYFSPNTHLLGEAVALFFIGTLCPQLVAAKRWQRLGWEIVLREATRQVQSDGMYFEQSIHYHIYALDFFLHSRILAEANQIPIPPELDQTVQKMLELLCRLSQAGVPPRLGDDDGGRLFDPQRNRADHCLDPLATGAVLFGRADFKARANLSEETVWLLGCEGVARFDRLPNVLVARSSAAFQACGIYIMAESEPVPQQVVIDAGRLGASRGGHGHADALSVCLTVNNRGWLVDSGTFCYVSKGNERDLFRGTAAHNTLRVDGADQAEPSEPFAWHSQPEVRVERWVAAQSFDLLVASHTGYLRLAHPVLHRRSVFHLKSRFWLVVDFAQGEGFHQLELFWHLAPGSITRLKTPTGFYFVAEDQSALALLTVEDHDWTQKITEGWCSPAYGKKESSQVLQFAKNTQLPTEFATLLQPGSAQCRELGHFVSLKNETEAKGVYGYRYGALGESHYIFLKAIDDGTRWKLGPWRSDASFLYCGVTAQGSLRHIALSGGSFVEMDHRRIFSARRAVSCFEWVREGAGAQIACSDEKAIDVVPKRSLSHKGVTLAGDQVQNADWGGS